MKTQSRACSCQEQSDTAPEASIAAPVRDRVPEEEKAVKHEQEVTTGVDIPQPPPLQPLVRALTAPIKQEIASVSEVKSEPPPTSFKPCSIPPPAGTLSAAAPPAPPASAPVPQSIPVAAAYRRVTHVCIITSDDHACNQLNLNVQASGESIGPSISRPSTSTPRARLISFQNFRVRINH